MTNNGNEEVTPNTGRSSRRGPWTEAYPKVVVYLLGVAALVSAYQHMHGVAISSPGYVVTFAAVDFVLGVLLIWGADRASMGVSNVILIVALLGTAALVARDMWNESAVIGALVDTVLVVVIPGLLLIRPRRHR